MTIWGTLVQPQPTALYAGIILTAVGVAVAFAVRALSFARYMHLEDLGLDVDPAVGPELFTLLVAPTVAERSSSTCPWALSRLAWSC